MQYAETGISLQQDIANLQEDPEHKGIWVGHLHPSAGNIKGTHSEANDMHPLWVALGIV